MIFCHSIKLFLNGNNTKLYNYNPKRGRRHRLDLNHSQFGENKHKAALTYNLYSNFLPKITRVVRSLFTVASNVKN